MATIIFLGSKVRRQKQYRRPDEFCQGDKVYWHDPAEEDYEECDLKIQRETVYTILELREDTALITSGVGETEVYLSELEHIDEKN